jgi:hypothetical protein
MKDEPTDATDDPPTGSKASGVGVFRRNPRSAWGLTFPQGALRRAALAAVLGVVVGVYAIVCANYVLRRIHMDFFGVWSWARFEIEQPPERIYDHAGESGATRTPFPAQGGQQSGDCGQRVMARRKAPVDSRIS